MQVTFGKPGRLAGEPHCPACGGGADAFTAYGQEATAERGDIGVCLYCLTPLIYDGEPLRPRLPTAEERAELAMHHELQRALMVLRMRPPRLRRPRFN